MDEPPGDRFELEPGELDDEPEAFDELEQVEPELTPQELKWSAAARISRSVGIITWVVGGLMAMQNLNRATKRAAGEGSNIGHDIDRVIFVAIPLVVALIAIVKGFQGLRSPAPEDRSKATTGLVLGGSWVLVVCLGFGFVAFQNYSESLNWTRVERPQRSDEPLSKVEVEAFAARVEEGFRKRDLSVLTERCDLEALQYEVFQGIDVERDYLESYRRAQAASLKKVWAPIVTELGDSATVEMIRYDLQGKPRVVFRALSDGVNYFEFSLARGKDGRVSWYDFYAYYGATRFTKMARDMNIDTLARLREGEGIERTRTVKRLAVLVQEGKWQAFMEAYRDLPPEDQQAREFLLLRLRAAEQISPEDYTAALDAFEVLGPQSDPGMALTLYNAYFDRQQWDRCERALDQLYVAVGDPYLHSLRCYVLLERKDPRGALASARKAVEGEPDRDHGHLAILEVALVEKDHALAAKTITFLEATFGYDYKAFVSTEPSYAAFRASPEGQAWLANR